MTSSSHTPGGLPLDGVEARTLAASAAGRNTAVSVAETPVGPAVIKLHARRERWIAETAAYTTWVPAVATRAPQLLGISDDPPALILSAVPGERLDRARLDHAVERSAHAQLGDFLRAFHASEPTRHGTGIASWLAERGRHWLALGHDVFPAGERRHTEDHLAALEQLGDLPAVPCHLDFTPSNAIIAADGEITVIDYEHARYDLASRDLVRLHDRVWPQRPDLATAFLDAYGPLSDLDKEIIRHTTALDRLTRRLHRQRAIP